VNRVEFLNAKGLPEAWRDHLEKDETVKSVIEVLESENPTRNPESCPEKDINVRYGFALAYGKILNTFQELAVVTNRSVDPTKKPSTYQTKRKQNASRTDS
jgi:hypothetical protein